MFHLNVSASVIFAACASPVASGDSLLSVSVSPSTARCWPAALFGDGEIDRLSADGTFDVRVDWRNGAYTELLHIPLCIDDTLVIDRNGELHVCGAREEVYALRAIRSADLCAGSESNANA